MDDSAILDLHGALPRFGLKDFRPGQAEVISAVLTGHDCLCIMPTGGGKSLCYQLPSLNRDGVTLVVSPLIALMKDQVDALDQLRISATFINSSLSPSEQSERLRAMAAGQYDLVYIAPERLRNGRFLDAVRQTQVQLLAVDEAHCISEWGHDFRPDYARLGKFRERLGQPQTIALTATATPTVRDDVMRLLGLRDPKIFVTGFARPNLRFEVREPGSAREKDEILLEFLRGTPGSGIIYAATRKRCEELADRVQRDLAREKPPRRVGLYHAGMAPDQRRDVQERFMAGELAVIVATNAFGMGIDKSDLRFVVHYNMPRSLEAYYQEAGRAGRDGMPSTCLLLYSPGDRYVQEFFIENAYPSRGTVARVYEYLRRLDDDPIEITLEQLKERLELSTGSEGVGASEQVLEKCGALERLASHENQASVKIDSDLPTLVDLLPREARAQRRVLKALERIVADRRFERVYFQPRRLIRDCDMDREAVARALRELNKLKAFNYVAPFRGRAVRMLCPDVPFEQLQIDFDELERKKAAEYEKLDRVIRFARSSRCRQLEVLEYFGDPSRRSCGRCDNCSDTDAPVDLDGVDDQGTEAVLQAVQIALSGVARLRGRFGRQVVAQMLWGSKAAKLRKLKLDKLSTFGLLSHLQQAEVGLLLEGLIKAELIVQSDVERFRPVVQLTETGQEVMRGIRPLDHRFALPAELLEKLAGRRHVRRAPRPAPSPPSEDPAAAPPEAASEAPPEASFGASSETEGRARTGAPGSHDLQDAEASDDRPEHYWTWRLLEADFSIEEAARIRRLPEQTIREHLRLADDELKKLSGTFSKNAGKGT